jgi:7-cyano-7-deazaguanine synthase in queuosine biosynthesis
MTRFELLPADATPHDGAARPLRWSRSPANTDTVTSDLGWDLHRMGAVPVPTGDLLRVAAAAYLADRLTSRGRTFTRSIEVTVHLLDPAPWVDTAADQTADLLSWLTGDAWAVQAVPADATEPPDPAPPADEVMLLSGGLDSLCGTLDRLGDGANRLLLSHGDGTTAVRRAQRLAYAWLRAQTGTTPQQTTVTFAQTGAKQESSTRSRSLLFVGLAVAAATASGARHVVVPENGYTSINPPLVAARGGALSTRSTHPTTFARINALLGSLGIAVDVANPYQPLTKGELLAKAAPAETVGFGDAAAGTLSCGKLDGARYQGGNPNYNCGLCVPCIVRRASFLAAGTADATPYLVDTLPAGSRARLLANRQEDSYAVQQAIMGTVSDTDLLACGPWPDDFDLDVAADLCNRGLRELARVPLP